MDTPNPPNAAAVRAFTAAVGTLIAKAAKDAGMSQRTLAELSDISLGSVNRALRGTTPMTTTLLFTLCHLVGADPTDVVRQAQNIVPASENTPEGEAA